MADKIEKTNDEWREQLSPEAFHVTRNKGTERAFTGELTDNKRAGHYKCTCCDAHLFTSNEKFDSRCGWPSFFAEAAEGNIYQETDTSHGMVRVEILCSRCDAHLGHVFDDGPEPTGLRYCVNSVSLKFEEHPPADSQPGDQPA